MLRKMTANRSQRQSFETEHQSPAGGGMQARVVLVSEKWSWVRKKAGRRKRCAQRIGIIPDDERIQEAVHQDIYCGCESKKGAEPGRSRTRPQAFSLGPDVDMGTGQ